MRELYVQALWSGTRVINLESSSAFILLPQMYPTANIVAHFFLVSEKNSVTENIFLKRT